MCLHLDAFHGHLQQCDINVEFRSPCISALHIVNSLSKCVANIVCLSEYSATDQSY